MEFPSVQDLPSLLVCTSILQSKSATQPKPNQGLGAENTVKKTFYFRSQTRKFRAIFAAPN